MRLSDVMSHAGLALYAEIALIIFFLVFIAIVARLLIKQRRDDVEHMARLPLDDDASRTRHPGVNS